MYNKVEYNGETLIDLTDTTAEESDVLQGKKFHDRSGVLRNGNFVPTTYTAGAGIDITNDKISAKCDGTTIKTNANGELEVKPDVYEEKKAWTTLLTTTTTEDAVFQLDDTSVGVDLNSYKEIQIIFELPSRVTAFLHNFWKYNNAYTTRVLGSFSSMEMQNIVVKVKKEYGIWWIEDTIGIQYDRLAQHWKQVYRQGTSNLVFASFEGMRFALSTTNVLPTGTKIKVGGLK